MPHCVAYKCSNDAKKKDPSISFHLLPGVNRLSVRKKWINAIKRPHSNLPKKPHLCSIHFEESCFDRSFEMKSRLVGKRRLKHDAVPTLFFHKPPPTPRRTSLSRFARKSREEVLQSAYTEISRIVELESSKFEGPADPEVEQPTDNSDMLNEDVIPSMTDSKVETMEVAVQTDPKIMISVATQVEVQDTYDTDEHVGLDESFEQFSGNEMENDDYLPSSQDSVTTSSSMVSDGGLFDVDEVVLVHMRNLKTLFCHCPKCGSLVDLDNVTVKENEGALLTVKTLCVNSCHFDWKSQNMQKHANMHLVSAITLSGIMFEKFQQMASLLKLRSISHTTFYKLRRNHLFPAIEEEWRKEQAMVIESLKERQESLMLAGDGRCDSPGHSAKYGTYTMIDTDTDKVVDFEVVKVMDVKNSNGMEKEGFIRTLTRIEKDFGCEVYGVSTDRHVQIKKYMREQQKEKVHQIDPWHLAKGINKKITGAAKKSNCTELMEWSPSVINHFWWAVDSCGGRLNWLRSSSQLFTTLSINTVGQAVKCTRNAAMIQLTQVNKRKRNG